MWKPKVIMTKCINMTNNQMNKYNHNDSDTIMKY